MASKSQNTNKNFTKRNTRKRSPRNSEEKTYRKGKDESVMEKREGGNDPRWYGPAPYVDAVARFNFVNPLGKPIPIQFANDPQSDTTIGWAASDTTPVVPGVMSIDFLPTIGVCRDSNDPMNCYLRSMFTKLRSTNNQSAPYQPADLGMYIMCIDSINMVLAQLVRMYGLARLYSPLNRYMPTAYLEACGVNPNHSSYKLYSNLADFRAEILALMLKCQTLAIPRGMNFCERHRQIVSEIYSDGETPKAQAYVFRTSYVYRYDETASSDGGIAVAEAVPAYGSSAISWIQLAHTLIDALTKSSLFAIASGDIIKSFGYDKLYQFPFFEETYMLAPVYNPEMLLQIHNIKVAGDRFDTTSFNMSQDPGTASLVSAPYCGVTGATAGGVYPIIDVPVEAPDSDTVMVATRLANVGLWTWDTTASKYKYVPSAIGSELVTSLTITVLKLNGTVERITTYNNCVGNSAGYIRQIALEDAFDWHPPIYHLLGVSASDHNLKFYSVISELQNYTTVDPGDLTKMHEFALFGLLTVVDVPTAGINP